MLPSYTTNRFNGSRSYIPEYLRRIIHYPQMDIEYTFWFVPPLPQSFISFSSFTPFE